MYSSAPTLLLMVTMLVVGCGQSPRNTMSDDVDGRPTAGQLGLADSLITSWVDSERLVGAVLLVSQGGETLLQRAYGSVQRFEYGQGQYESADGIRRVGDPIAMTLGTRFDLASVTKVMATTFAVMWLVDRGQVELDAPLYEYLPDFRGAAKDSIRVHHLLTHRAGLLQWQPIYYDAGNAHEAYDVIRALPLAWGVGEERHYSDLGFMLLGRVVENVSGETLDAFLAQRLYQPLGLERTGFRPAAGPFAATSHGNPFERRMVRDTTFGYRYDGAPDSWDRWREYTLVGEVNDGNAHHAFQGVAGHAGLFSTAADLQALLELLLNRGTLRGERIVDSTTVALFLAPRGDRQALGWQLPRYAPNGSFGHTGFTGTFVLGVPDDMLALVLLTNRQNVGVDGGTSYPDVGPLQESLVRLLVDCDPPERRCLQ